jgi:hypothetical protein
MSQISIVDPLILKGSLESLGYKLKDYGSYWRACAIYRGGDNSTALKIYKNSGVWTDYAEGGSRSYPFQRLVELTLDTKDTHVINKYTKFDHQNIIHAEVTERIEMEKIYPESLLENLLPHLDFYHKKNISGATLQFYKCGYATNGQMFRRIVFPIYNQYGQIHGFSGRAIFWEKSSEFPKWKHLGKRASWVYPLYVKRNGIEEVKEAVEQSKRVFIVESVGDSMALFENGHKNNIVTFGLGISSKVCSALLSLDVEKITIAYNNDSQSETNHGLVSACKAYLQLCSVFDPAKLEIRLPVKNDFSDMFLEENSGEIFQAWLKKSIDQKEQIKAIKEIAIANNFPDNLIDRATKILEDLG